jgi:hypothetical protein
MIDQVKSCSIGLGLRPMVWSERLQDRTPRHEAPPSGLKLSWNCDGANSNFLQKLRHAAFVLFCQKHSFVIDSHVANFDSFISDEKGYLVERYLRYN